VCVAAIVSTLKQVPAKVWEKVLEESQGLRNIAFAVAVIQAMLVARQLFGAQGLTQFYPFSNVQTSQAIALVLGKLLRPPDEDAGEPDKEWLTQVVSEVSLFNQFICFNQIVPDTITRPC